MAIPSVPVYDYSHAEPALADYTSRMLKMYIENLGPSLRSQMLDVGPVCEENIMYFAQRVKRLHVCDLFLRMNRNRSKGLPNKMLLEYLDYAPASFDGINLWDFIDYLKVDDIGKWVEMCLSLLKPSGMLTITSFEKQWAPPQTHTFVVNTGRQVTFRLQNHLDLPRYYHSNRILTAKLSEFQVVNSFIYRNGVREFLCRRD